MKKNLINVAETTINNRAKEAGMNYFQRKKLVKGCKRFAYDVGVETCSTLAVNAVSGTAYLAGKGIVKVGVLAGKGVTTGVKAVAGAGKAVAGKVVKPKKAKAPVEEAIA